MSWNFACLFYIPTTKTITTKANFVFEDVAVVQNLVLYLDKIYKAICNRANRNSLH